MYKKLLLVLLGALFIQNYALAQEFQVADASTKDPLPYVNISINSNAGTVSNEQGYFSIKNIKINDDDKIQFTCIGYKMKSLAVKELKSNPLVLLEEDIKLLDAITIKGEKLSLEDILENMADRMEENHPDRYLEHKLFYREASTSQIKKIDLTLKKVSGVSRSQLGKADEKIKVFEEKVKKDKTVYFTDFLAKMYKGKGDNLKINVEKASSLRDKSKNAGNENIQQQMSNIMLQYLDSTHYFNIRSGIINLVDSVRYSKGEGSIQKSKKDNYENLNFILEHAYQDLTISFDSKLDFIYYPEDYNYTMTGATTYDGKSVYVLTFKPKKKSSTYQGKIYVSTEDFGVLKTVFKIGEGREGPGLNLRFLLGLEFKTLKQQTTVIYNKNSDKKYFPAYISNVAERYVFFDRPLKISDITEPENKVRLNFKMETIVHLKTELLFLDSKQITKDAYENVAVKEMVDVDETEKYDPAYWDNTKVLAPLKEMREFSTKKEE